MAKQPAKKPAATTPAGKAKPAAKAKPAPAPSPEPKTAAAKPPARVKAATAGPLLPPPPHSKFTLYDTLGRPRAYYLVERVDLPRPAVDPKSKPPAHAVAVIDRSGSMYKHMRDVREALLRLFSQSEFKKQPLVISLVSFSGAGDFEVQLKRVPVAEVMQDGGDAQRQIKRMDVATLTSVSTGLRAADELIRPGEPTSVTLQSDGYSNDPSATAEAAALKTVVVSLRQKDVVVNTVAYSAAADFRQMMTLANDLSGRCVQAEGMVAIYDALHAGLTALATASEPPHELPLPAGCAFQVFVSKALKRVNAAAGPLRVVGLKPGHDATLYQYRAVGEGEYAAAGGPESQASEAVYAFARGVLAVGKLNSAKYAGGSAYDATLLEEHGRALTNPQVAAFAAALEAVIFRPETLAGHRRLSAVPATTLPPLLEVVHLLERHPDGYRLNLPKLKEAYPRRGVERVRGTRDAGGTLVEPWLRTEFLDPDDLVRVGSWDTSRTAATLNLTVGRRVRLVKVKGGEAVTAVAGAKLDDLKQYESFGIVADGELNVNRLPVRVTDRGLHDALNKLGVLEPGGKFDPKADQAVRFDHLPLVPPFPPALALDGLFDELAGLRVVSGIAAAHLKDPAAEFTTEQAEELKKHYLSRTLHLNFPTAAPYTDRLNALSRGDLDTRTTHRIDVGSKSVLTLAKLMPANKFLERMYEVKAGGKPVDKPKLDDALDGTWAYTPKHLSSRVKVTKADELTKEYFDEFLGLRATGKAVGVLHAVGATALAKIVEGRLKGKQPERAALVAALADAKPKLDARQDELFRDRLSALVFYIGSTGLLPDELDAPALSADQIAAKYPDLGVGKDERDGTFFEFGGTILAVYAKAEDYTPKKPGG